ncbi:MAG TPA: hypothetical protein VF827_10430, partial [Syntrophales bacterium]
NDRKTAGPETALLSYLFQLQIFCETNPAGPESSRCYRSNEFSADMTRMNKKEAGLLRPASSVIHSYC